MDRFTWGVVVGVVVLSIAAVASVVFARSGQTPPDLATPDGVVTAYVLAIQNRDADQAWEMLSGPEAISALGPAGSQPTRDTFRQQVNSSYHPGNRRLRIARSTLNGDAAKVEIEITTSSEGPFFLGGSSFGRTVAFDLRRQGASWRVISSPPVYELS